MDCAKNGSGKFAILGIKHSLPYDKNKSLNFENGVRVIVYSLQGDPGNCQGHLTIQGCSYNTDTVLL